MNLKNKVIVITGAGSGIGRCLAQKLHTLGAKIAISDVNEEGLAETLSSLIHGFEVKSNKLDVTNKDAFFRYAEEVQQHFGQVDAVINNAGVAVAASVVDCDIEMYEWLLNINLWGVLYGTKAFLPAMIKQGSGQVVNISSIFGIVTLPTLSAYHMSKFAVRGLNETLWQELKGTGVDCISVHPGGIKTNIANSGRSAGDDGIDMLKNFNGLLATTAESCAAQIIKGMQKGKRRVIIGSDAKFFTLLSRIFPNSYHIISEKILKLKMG